MQKPGPWRITFDTNPDQCNYKCVMCECFSPHSDVQEKRIKSKTPRRRMSIQLVRQVLEQAQGTPLREIIPSTMGEPLLYSDFEDIIELCREFNVKLNLTTNGSFPRKGAEAWAKLLVPITSDIKVSWNGATKETQESIMIGARWEKSLENLKTLIRIRDEHARTGGNRCRITLQTTFLETNANELCDLVKLGISLGVDRIKGHHLWAHFTEIKGLSMRRSQNSIERWNAIVRQAKEIARDQIILEHVEELDPGAVSDLVPGGVCPFLGNEAWVNAEGEFSPCCAPDELRKTLGEFGNLNEMTMEDIWTGQPYQHLRQTYQSHALCIGCNMKKPLTEVPQCSPC
ncbi:MAG: radical SAM protein [Myxococcaceae bacterium]